MGKIKSKRGQGLDFIAIIILIALLYFIFRYNTETYTFIMSAGDEQAHLITSYTETEKAKEFASTSLKQATYEQLWQEGIKTCSFNSICNKDSFLQNSKTRFDKSLLMYEPATELLVTEFPDYNLTFKSCSNTKLELEAFGFLEGCFIKPDFKFPEYPCSDFNETTNPKCTGIKFTDDTAGACKWIGTDCVETNPISYCEDYAESNCGAVAGCIWEKSYSENINVMSIPIADYQFRIDSNAHFVETIDCDGYNAFLKMRDVAIKPTCSLSVSPSEGAAKSKFTFSIAYADDVSAPKELELKISGPETASALKADMSGSGASWSYAKTVSTAGSYKVDLTCTDSAGQKATAKQISFTVK
jgi:hypothetical protein